MRLLLATLIAFAALSFAATAASLSPYPPGTNGCSAGISGYWRSVLHRVPPYERCCNAHDRAYRSGGTWDGRLAADAALLACIAKSAAFGAGIMWLGVRAFGTSFYIFDWRKIETDHAAQHQYRRAGAE